MQLQLRFMHFSEVNLHVMRCRGTTVETHLAHMWLDQLLMQICLRAITLRTGYKPA